MDSANKAALNKYEQNDNQQNNCISAGPIGVKLCFFQLFFQFLFTFK